LLRPDSPEAAQAIVDQYASGEPEVLRRDFYNSLLAAFTEDEIGAQFEIRIGVRSCNHTFSANFPA
jgi:hypothetical protein